MAFRFQQFVVVDDRSTMPVGTDAMLLGSIIDPINALSILEIGTGCGVIALMLAQRSDARIIALDIDEASVQQASKNFEASPWKHRLTAVHLSFQEYSRTTDERFDLIVSNPPFFQNSLKSPQPGRNIARHRQTLSFSDLAVGVARLLSEDGHFRLILPANDESEMTETAARSRLFVLKKTIICPKPGTDPNRIILSFSKEKADHITIDELIIRNSDNTFSVQYLALTKEFHYQPLL